MRPHEFPPWVVRAINVTLQNVKCDIFRNRWSLKGIRSSHVDFGITTKICRVQRKISRLANLQIHLYSRSGELVDRKRNKNDNQQRLPTPVQTLISVNWISRRSNLHLDCIRSNPARVLKAIHLCSKRVRHTFILKIFDVGRKITRSEKSVLYI